MTTQYTDDEVYERAVELFSSSNHWPKATVEDVIRLTNAKRLELNSLDYLAFQSINLSISACSKGGAWPPMSPSSFASTVMPGFRKDFRKFVTAVRDGWKP